MAEFEPKQFGKYFLTDKLAVGGMAEIYKAKTYGVDGFEKVLCIKRILPHAAADKDFVTMLIDEAKLSVLLSHANIVQVYDLGKVGDDYFIAMEFIHGVNLRDIMYACRETQRAIPPEIACFIASEICKGLDYAHRKTDADNQPLNIVHRDISPQNILLSYEGEVKIVDFGIAKAAMNISHTMAGILKGKIAYMSPEQAMGKAIDTRTDIFATGILLYEMLTGQKLFTGESQFEVLKKIRTSNITTDTLPDTIPEKLREIMAKALAANVEDRYQTAGDLQIDLTRYLYSSYADFSPRKIAELVQDLFKEEIAQEQEAKAREVAHEAQTTSMNVEEGARQVEIVQGTKEPGETEDTAASGTAATQQVPETTRPMAAATPPPPSTPPPAKKKKKWLWAIAALVILGAGIGAATSLFPQLKFWGKPAAVPTSDVTTATINSDPQGANVLVEGRRTGLRTPAVIPSLEVGKSYRIRLEKEQYIPVDQMLTISSALPLTVTIPLAKEAGSLKVSSNPIGAKIYLNGEDTNKVTPATLTKIPLGVDLRVTLMKEGFEDAEKVLKLETKAPQTLDIALNEIRPNTGSVMVSSEPAGAKIEIDGKDVKRVTPTKIVNLDLDKEHKIKLTMKDLETYEKTFTLKDKTPLEIKGELKPPAPKTGSIYVTSTPEGGRIFLDKKSTGKRTPATLTGLEVDKTYRVGVTNDGYKDYAKNVNVTEAKRYTVTASLAPKAKPEPPTTPTPPPTTPTQPKEEPSGVATLRITSTPSGADAYINGSRKGRTPLTVNVQPGRVRVTLKRSGYEDFTTRITARAGRTQNVGGALRARAARPEPTPPPSTPATGGYGQVSLSSTPPRATVTFDGQVIPAKTPVTVRRVATGRRHTVTISMPGYKSWTRSFTLTGNQSFHANLQPQ